LKCSGYDCTEAVDGVDALAKAKDSNFDLVITDLNMPNMDGMELTQHLRMEAAYAKTPILVLTTETEAGKNMQGTDSGVTGWIVKPFNPESLAKTIAGALG
jgi:two-component system chemotaxis response regulator CheY